MEAECKRQDCKRKQIPRCPPIPSYPTSSDYPTSNIFRTSQNSTTSWSLRLGHMDLHRGHWEVKFNNHSNIQSQLLSYMIIKSRIYHWKKIPYTFWSILPNEILKEEFSRFYMKSMWVEPLNSGERYSIGTRTKWIPKYFLFVNRILYWHIIIFPKFDV